MPDEVREYIRAAQQAELRGDKPQAVELLRKAAALVRASGNFQRAIHLLRHAQRLDDTPDVADEIRRMEWLPDKPLLRAVADAEGETEAALEPLRELERSDRRLIERGPTLADPELAAWCSFCCRPRTEVGNLVAGPAGAFICAGCLRESSRLLEIDAASLMRTPVPGSLLDLAPAPAPEPVPPPASPPPKAPAHEANGEGPAGVELVGQRSATDLVQRGLELGLGWILVVGPEGSGKTAFLRALEKRGAGRYLSSPAALAEPWGDERLLVDGLDGGSRSDDQVLVDALGRVRRAVIAVRGAPLPAPLVAASDGGDLPIYPTRDLLAACQGALPAQVAERIQLAASFQAPTAEELVEVGRRLLVARASELDLSDDLLAALAAEAARSPRGAHELRSLLDRIPPGSWTLKSTPAQARARAQAPAQAPPKAQAGTRKRRSRGKGETPP